MAAKFFISWDGLSFLLSPTWAPLPVSSDVAEAVGYGAISGHEWFEEKWAIAQQSLSIAYMYKKRFPLVVAALLLGHRWATTWVEFRLDNMVVVSLLRSGTSKDPNMMVLLRYLSPVAACNSFAFPASYTPRWDNAIVDALTCFDFQCFHHLAPHAAHIATPILPSLSAQLPVIRLESAKVTWLMALPLQLIKSMAQLNTSS